MIVLFLASILSLFVSPDQLKTFRITGQAQGTTFQITYYAGHEFVTPAAIDSIFKKIDSSLSVYKEYSLVSNFNRSRNGILMDEHFKAVITQALEIFKSTGGISDPTVYPLVNAWGFGPVKPPVDPGPDRIREILSCVGAGKLQVQGNRLVKKQDCVQIDLNGIAQGYTVDLLADFLESFHILNYLVEVGGEIRVKGRKYPSGEMMTLGIESPSNEDLKETIINRVIQTETGALTTSGNYRKFHLSGGKRISHLIDPISGYPFSNELISVSIFTEKAIVADGYDHALMGMGLQKALLFLQKHPEMEAYFIYRKPDGHIADTATAGFYKLIK